MSVLDREYGAFLPTTDTFDRAIIDNLKIQEDLKEFLVMLYQTTNNIALMVNIKESGYYVEEEFVNGKLWYPNKALSSSTAQRPEYRQEFRRVIDFGALPAAGAKAVNHNITTDANTRWKNVYATATNTTTFAGITITTSAALSVRATATQVIITTGGVDYSAYNACDVIVEFIRQ